MTTVIWSVLLSYVVTGRIGGPDLSKEAIMKTVTVSQQVHLVSIRGLSAREKLLNNIKLVVFCTRQHLSTSFISE